MLKSKIRTLAVGASVASLVSVSALTLTGPVQAAPVAKAAAAAAVKVAKPPVPAVTKQAVPPRKAKQEAPKEGATTKLVKVDARGKKLAGFQAAAGNVAGIDFDSQLNYCSGGLTYTPVKNATGVAKNYQVVFYNGGVSRTFYGSVANGSTAYVSFAGVQGATYSYLYVLNGSSYVYDEYLGGANNCSVSRSFTEASGYAGYVKYTFTNSGNAYATVESNEMWPYATTGTYTGRHWDYPAAGGTVVRYYWVGAGNPYRFYDTSAGLYSPNVSTRVDTL